MMFRMCTLHNAQRSCRRPSKQQWKGIPQFFRPHIPVTQRSKCQHARLHRLFKPQPLLPFSPLQRRASTSPWEAHPQCCPRPPRSSCEQPLRTALLPQSPSPSACHCPGPAKRSESILRICAASAQANPIYYVPPRLAQEALLPLPMYISYKRTFTMDRRGRKTPSPSPEYSEGRPLAIAW